MSPFTNFMWHVLILLLSCLFLFSAVAACIAIWYFVWSLFIDLKNYIKERAR